MTDTGNIHLRVFTFISFLVREGKVYRQDKCDETYSVTDNVPLLVLRRVERLASSRRQVLVFEHGVVKADWCALEEYHYKALMHMDEAEGWRLMGGCAFGYPPQALQSHLARSFPAYTA